MLSGATLMAPGLTSAGGKIPGAGKGDVQGGRDVENTRELEK